jgi:hypothetical protein
MNPIASYSFLPWLRQGVANTITAQDLDPSVKTRASVHVALQLSGDPVAGGTGLVQPLAQDIALYGPGDIIGIDTRAIFRRDPLPWITNYESNYLPPSNSMMRILSGATRRRRRTVPACACVPGSH